MIRKIFHNKPLFITLCLILVAALLTVAGYAAKNRSDPVSGIINTIAAPVRSGISALKDQLSTFRDALSQNHELKDENESLRARIAELEKTVRDSEQYAEENESLRGMLDVYGTDTEYTFCMATVIGRNALTWNRTLTIDCGIADGISAYDPVITSEGLVGYVSSVDISTCTVVAVTDTAMSCSAILSSSHETGVAEGDFDLMGSGKLQMSMLPADATVSVGEVACTSGLGGILPEGLVIGTVDSVFTEANGLTQTAVLSPSVNAMQVRTVYVITDYHEVRK